VWGWIATIHTLDITTGWILDTKVGSYPLCFCFKLFFGLTYQTYGNSSPPPPYKGL
jgi:hypothetical protein